MLIDRPQKSLYEVHRVWRGASRRCRSISASSVLRAGVRRAQLASVWHGSGRERRRKNLSVTCCGPAQIPI